MALQLDHIVVLVKNLKKALTDFQSLGFQVSMGGAHSGGYTHNALIHFPNGTFIELLAVRKSLKNTIVKFILRLGFFRKLQKSKKRGFVGRFLGRAFTCSEGMTDFCLLAKEGLADYENIKKRGIELTDAVEMNRLRPDGILLKWQIFSTFIPELPFVMTPYQPQIKPDLAKLNHPNGIKGIEKVCLRSPHFQKLIGQYEMFLGSKAEKIGEEKVLFHLQKGQIEIILDNRANDKRGFGIFGIQFLSKKPIQLEESKLQGLVIV